MKKISILAQWIVLLAAAGFLAHTILRPVAGPVHNPEIWRHWQGFHVLSYEGVTQSDNPRHVSPERLAGHLHALRQAGWNTITTEDVFRFYAESQPLPDKALLLIFEGGRKDQMVRATPLLEANGFVAHLAVPSAVTRQWGNHYLKSVEIEKISRMPHWRFISMGHDAIRAVPLDAAGNFGNFLSQRAWTPGGPESDAQFRDRIAEDFREASLKLSRWTGSYPNAYLFPYADAGASPNADPLSAALVHQELSRWHTLAFLGEGDSFNSHRTDPFRLTRLRVRGDWSAGELLSRMRSFDAPGYPAVSSAEGASLPEKGTLHLPAARHGADLRFSINLRLRPDTHVEVFLRHNGPDSHIRLTLRENQLLLHEKHLGPMVKLAEAELTSPDPTLSLLLKNNRIRIDVDGQTPVPPIPVQVLEPGSLFIHNPGADLRIDHYSLQLSEPLYLWGSGLHEVARHDLDAAQGVFFPLPAFPLEAHLTDWVRLAAQGVHAVPVLVSSGEEEAFETLHALLQARRNHPALSALLSRVAVPAELEKVRQDTLDAGLKLYTLITTDAPVPRLGNGEILVFRTSENPGQTQSPPWTLMVESPARDAFWPPDLIRVHSTPEFTP